MKIKQIINESDYQKQLEKYFLLSDDIEITDQGLSTKEVHLKTDVNNMPEVPRKFNKVSERFSVSHECGLISLKNFPNETEILRIGYQEKLKFSSTDPLITCEDLFLTNLPQVKNFLIFPFKTKRVYISRCDIESLDGLPKHMTVSITYCNNLKCDLTKYKDINQIVIDIDSLINSQTKISIPKLLAFKSSILWEPSIYIDKNVKSKNEELNKLLELDRQPDNLIKFMSILRDAGYPHLARI